MFILPKKMTTDISRDLQQQAILAALSAKWEEALKFNQQIIDLDPKNVEALNRIGRAYFELGDIKKAKNYFNQALEADPYNQIAAKFLKKIEAFIKAGPKSENLQTAAFVCSDSFIEEPGKTTTIGLLKVAEPYKLSLLSPGAEVRLVPKNRGVTITDLNNKYLGVLPDDISHRLIRLIHGGNKYQALIKNLKTNSISILIREIHRSSRFRNQPSFIDGSSSKFAYSSDHIILSDNENDLSFEPEEEEAV